MDDVLVSFSVSCKHTDVPRVKNLLSDLGMTRIVAADDHIHGVCEMHELRGLMDLLTQNKITGFTHDAHIDVTPHFSSRSGVN